MLLRHAPPTHDLINSRLSLCGARREPRWRLVIAAVLIQIVLGCPSPVSAQENLEQSLGEASGQRPKSRSSPANFAKSRSNASATLSDFDRKLDCQGLASAVAELVDQMKRLQAAARKESAAPAANLARLSARSSNAPGAGIEALEDHRLARARADALAALAAAKGCVGVDVASSMRLAATPPLTSQDRCRVRSNFELEDCVEDIAQWRCRALAGKGRSYLECLEKVGLSVISASGFERPRLAHFGPGCNDKSYKPDTCSVFSNDRNGAGTQWCKRLDEAAIEVCDIAAGKPKAESSAPKTEQLQDRTSRKGAGSPLGNIFAQPTRAPVKDGATKDSRKTNCHKVQCGLGTCRRLCAPPV